jgi:hypothetical protein
MVLPPPTEGGRVAPRQAAPAGTIYGPEPSAARRAGNIAAPAKKPEAPLRARTTYRGGVAHVRGGESKQTTSPSHHAQHISNPTPNPAGTESHKVEIPTTSKAPSPPSPKTTTSKFQHFPSHEPHQQSHPVPQCNPNPLLPHPLTHPPHLQRNQL